MRFPGSAGVRGRGGGEEREGGVLDELAWATDRRRYLFPWLPSVTVVNK